MNVSQQLKKKRDQEARSIIPGSKGNYSMELIQDEEGNDIEIVKPDGIPDNLVNTLNTLSGDLNLIPGKGISIDIIGNDTIRINNTSEGGNGGECPSSGGYAIGYSFINHSQELEYFDMGVISNEADKDS